jgi:hypothetical protein
MRTASASTGAVGLSQDAGELELQQQLYFVLIMLCTGSAMSELRAVPDNNGLEAWRRRCQRYEPKTRNRTLQLLEACLSPDLSGENAASVHDKVLQWELAIQRYNPQAALSDDIKIATLMKSISEPLRYALLQFLGGSSATVTYQAIHEYLLRFLASARVWTEHANDDMQVGAVKG